MSLARLAVLAALAAPAAAQATPDPVLLVVAQRDFYAPDLLPLRDALHAEGVPTRIASATLDAAVAHDGTLAQPDVRLADADASDYSALAFIGGWGAASFAERFDGTFPAYEPAPGAGALVADFLAQ